MVRLPNVGESPWGTVMNDYLRVAHAANLYSGADHWYARTHDVGGTTVSMTDGLLIVFPVPFHNSVNIKGFAARVLTAGSTCKFAFYRDDETGYPSSLVSGTTVSVDTSSTGVKTVAVSPSVNLTVGLYHLATLALGGTTIFPAFGGRETGHIGSYGSGATPDLQFSLAGFWMVSGQTDMPSSFPSSHNVVNFSPQVAFRIE